VPHARERVQTFERELQYETEENERRYFFEDDELEAPAADEGVI
jgi:hypothetical protein